MTTKKIGSRLVSRSLLSVISRSSFSVQKFSPRLFWRMETFLRAAWYAVKPGPLAVRGAGRGVLIVCGLVCLLYAIYMAKGPLEPGIVMVLGILLLGVLLLFLGQLLARLVEWIAQIPWGLRWPLIGGLLLLTLALLGANPLGTLAAVAALLACAMLLGGGIAALAQTGWKGLTRVQRAISVLGVLVGMAGLMAGLYAYGVYRGFPDQAAVSAAKQAGSAPARLALDNPSKPGQYPVKTLTYGAGSDRFRPEYASGAALKTQTVDGSKLLKGSWDGISGQLRTLYWGFDGKNLPLNGRVWYPDAAAGEDSRGPFPLVLIVHGNHLSSDFSDPGYAYLGELLASRGFIFVSVDENFLNGSVTDFVAGIKGENDARGWLLLEHLKTWDGWNRSTSNPFYQSVDMSNIAVMGHSRGGEAAAIAAAFNRLPYYPDDYRQAFDFNYNIRAVAAIAPCDGQYKPSWRGTPLSNLSYFVLQGSHDSDVSSFMGMSQYERVKFNDGKDWFKSALYIYRANHGQFNAVWGDNDLGMPRGGFLNRTALLSAAEQAQIAKVYLSAFLEATLHGQRGYLPLFQDARAAGAGWLPDDIYINRLDQAGDRMLATYDEDINLRTTTAPGGRIDGSNLAFWREQPIVTRWGGGESKTVYLGWNRPASYEIALPAQGFPTAAGDVLIFSIADAGPDADTSETLEEAGEEKGHSGPRQPIDLTVLLKDASGEAAALPLSRYLPVQPQLIVRLYKFSLFEPKATAEPILQSYVLPLADFVQANPRFHPEALRTIRFVFDRTKPGFVVLDGVGVRPGPALP